MALKEINTNDTIIKVDTSAQLAGGDRYWSNYHEQILVVVNEMHAKGLNLLNENKFGTLTEKDFNWKVI